MSNCKIFLILQSLLFIIPMNIYIIGDWVGAGVQTLFFRYNQTTIGQSLILLPREISFVLNGTLNGKSAFASVIWCAAVFLICIATLILIHAYLRNNAVYVKYSAGFNLGGALLMTIAIGIQYGVTFHGPAGIAIPFGIPVILGVAYWQYHWNQTSPEFEDESV
jgi:hypothetical protein